MSDVLRPRDTVRSLRANRNTSAAMRESSQRRRCPSCERLNALCRYSRLDDAWQRCRYCGHMAAATQPQEVAPCHRPL